MSLPMAATGPLKVEIKPIFTVFCCASAGPVASARAAPAAIHVFVILPLLCAARCISKSPVISKYIEVLPVLPFADLSLIRLAGRFFPAPRDLSFLDLDVIVHKSVAKSGPETGVRAQCSKRLVQCRGQ